MVPVVGMLAIIVALRWLIKGDRYRRIAVAHAAALATGTVLLAV
jgi:hypothetical protein